MDPLDREMLTQLRDTRIAISRNRAIAQTTLALVACLVTVGTVTEVYHGTAAVVALGLGAVALVLALLANRARTRDRDDETTTPAVTPAERATARREHSTELGHLRGLARLQGLYLTGAGLATMAGVVVILLYT